MSPLHNLILYHIVGVVIVVVVTVVDDDTISIPRFPPYTPYHDKPGLLPGKISQTRMDPGVPSA